MVAIITFLSALMISGYLPRYLGGYLGFDGEDIRLPEEDVGLVFGL